MGTCIVLLKGKAIGKQDIYWLHIFVENILVPISWYTSFGQGQCCGTARTDAAPNHDGWSPLWRRFEWPFTGPELHFVPVEHEIALISKEHSWPVTSQVGTAPINPVLLVLVCHLWDHFRYLFKETRPPDCPKWHYWTSPFSHFSCNAGRTGHRVIVSQLSCSASVVHWEKWRSTWSWSLFDAFPILQSFDNTVNSCLWYVGHVHKMFRIMMTRIPKKLECLPVVEFALVRHHFWEFWRPILCFLIWHVTYRWKALNLLYWIVLFVSLTVYNSRFHFTNF